MPNQFPCPECGAVVRTFMRVGESATCPKCDEVVSVPDEALEVEPTPHPLVAGAAVQRATTRFSEKEREVSRAAATWLPRMGTGVLVAVILLFFICMPEDGAKEATWFLWLPVLFLSAIGLITLGLVVGSLNGIRHELRAMRKERAPTGS